VGCSPSADKRGEEATEEATAHRPITDPIFHAVPPHLPSMQISRLALSTSVDTLRNNPLPGIPGNPMCNSEQTRSLWYVSDSEKE